MTLRASERDSRDGRSRARAIAGGLAVWLACAVALTSGGAAIAQQSVPPLSAYHARLAESAGQCLARAEQALQAEGLRRTPDTGISRGGTRDYAQAIVHCLAIDGGTMMDVVVAGAPGQANLSAGLRDRLRDRMTASAPANRSPSSPPASPPSPAAAADWRASASGRRDQQGRQFTFTCPPAGTKYGVWGTDIYTDDSSVCTAAVHAGLITLANGGSVTIQIVGAQSGFTGSTRNGITSSAYGAWGGAFRFTGGGGSRVVDREIYVQLPAPGAEEATWSSGAGKYRGANGSRHTYYCPPAGKAVGVWGTDVYTDDSSVCTAAVHAGAITLASGGNVTFEILPGQSAYTGSERNGITSSRYSSWSGSFRIVRP